MNMELPSGYVSDDKYSRAVDDEKMELDPPQDVASRCRYPKLRIALLAIISVPFFGQIAWSSYRFLCPCPEPTFLERSYELLRDNPLIDGHNDLLITIRGNSSNHINSWSFRKAFEFYRYTSQVDIPRLYKGHSGGAFWSAFLPCPIGPNGTDFSTSRYDPIVAATLEQLDLFHRLATNYPRWFTPTGSAAEAEAAFRKGKLISPVIIEGLHQIGNSVANLRLYHRLGVRYATLTWNCHNKYADAALESGENWEARVATPYWHGLSPAGRDIVKEMNRMGMMVDLAHVSVETMRDVLIGNGSAAWSGSLAPPIFSHSSAYAICPHPRNVPDEILQLVKKRRSVVMINFSPAFIACVPGKNPGDLPETVMENATLAQVVRHIRHVGEFIGYDYVGIGTDYDGIDRAPVGLEDVSKFPALVAELLRQGISEKDVVKIMGGNVLRVWKEADRIATMLQATTEPLEEEPRNFW